MALQWQRGNRHGGAKPTLASGNLSTFMHRVIPAAGVTKSDNGWVGRGASQWYHWGPWGAAPSPSRAVGSGPHGRGAATVALIWRNVGGGQTGEPPGDPEEREGKKEARAKRVGVL